jgi:dethiobiotin synthase
MLSGLFITGTDTNVGKTAACAALLHRFRDRLPRYWKPIQTGIETDDDTAEVQRLSECEDARILREGVRLPKPVSPHLAARWANQPIQLRPLFETLSSNLNGKPWIIEGAGGALVPINDTQLISDLMELIGLPVLVVARTALGTINHTLLTIEALRTRSIRVAGVIMIGERDDENAASIEKFGKVPVFAQMPRFDELTPRALQQWAESELDPKGRLLEYLK